MNKILQKYKNDLKKFIEKNNLDKENFSDIEKRINEKLSKIQNPTESDIKNILHEIGTPEEIFAEELGEKMLKEPKNLWEKIMQKTEKVIFLGVFYELGQKTGISGNIYRIMFLFLLSVGVVAGVGEIIVFLIFSYIFGFLFLRTGIIRFFFSGFLALICVIITIPAILILGAYIANIQIDNIYPFIEISYLLPIGLGIGIFSMIILAIFFFYYAFFGKTFGVKFFLTGIISFVIAITIGAGVLGDLAQKYLNKKEEIINISLPVKNGEYIKSYYINQNTSIFETYRGEIMRPKYIGLSKDDKIHIKIKNIEFGNEKINKINKGLIKKIYANIENNIFFIGIEKQNIEERKGKKYAPSYGRIYLEEIYFPENFIFYALGDNIEMYGLFKDIKFKDSEKYDEGIRRHVKFFCNKYFLDNAGELNCEDKDAEGIIKRMKGDFSIEEGTEV